MLKGLIFDLDGTTLDTLEDIVYSYNATLKDVGLETKSEDAIRMGVGRGFRNLVNNTFPNLAEEKREEIALAYRKKYGENYYKHTHPYPGMFELLKTLNEKGILLAVNSNKSDIYVKDLIARNYPGINFVAVMGSMEGIALKPDPQATEIIIKKMGLKKEEVAYVGDSETDILTGINAGVKTFAFLWGFRDKKTLIKAGADLLFESPKELSDYLKEEINNISAL